MLRTIFLLVFLILPISSFSDVTSKEIVSWEGTINGEYVKITDKGLYKSNKFKKTYHLSDRDLCIYGNSNFPLAQRAMGNAAKLYKKEWLSIIYQREIEYLPYCYSLRRNFRTENKISEKKYVEPSIPAETEISSIEKKVPVTHEDWLLCKNATEKFASQGKRQWKTSPSDMRTVLRAKRQKLDCLNISNKFHQSGSDIMAGYGDIMICDIAKKSPTDTIWSSEQIMTAVCEAEKRRLNCNTSYICIEPINGENSINRENEIASTVTPVLGTNSVPEPKAQQQQTLNSSKNNESPLIDQLAYSVDGKQGTITGRVSDDVGIAEVLIDNRAIAIQPNGKFNYQTFVPSNGINLRIVATDLSGLSSEKFVALERPFSNQAASITFDRLNPLGKKVTRNDNAIALIIGIANYENTPAKAIYADSDALMFKDYTSEKLGIPENRIKTMVNDKADEREFLLSVKSWLARSVRQDQTDVYVFFAGHGLASDDGEKMYLLPYDGSPQLLDRTAILRDELFSDIAAANPRSVTVFLDTCYSGTTRGTDMLVTSRPIAIRAKQQNIPDGFTVFTAAGGDQTAKPLEEAKHGMFSYFLMKGMEGDADSNQDNQITAAELHEHVEQNVIQQSGGSQVPELQGDAGRVLVSFQ